MPEFFFTDFSLLFVEGFKFTSNINIKKIFYLLFFCLKTNWVLIYSVNKN